MAFWEVTSAPELRIYTNFPNHHHLIENTVRQTSKKIIKMKFLFILFAVTMAFPKYGFLSNCVQKQLRKGKMKLSLDQLLRLAEIVNGMEHKRIVYTLF